MQTIFKNPNSISDWDTEPDERKFLGTAYLLLATPGYKDHVELARLLRAGVDETWFADRYRGAIFSGTMAALLAANDKGIVRGQLIVQHAEKVMGEEGWAAKEISACQESVGYADIDQIIGEQMPLWWQKLKRRKMITVLGMIDQHLSTPPSPKRMVEIDKRIAEGLELWREKPDFTTPEENPFDSVMRKAWEPFPENAHFKTGLPSLDVVLGGGICGKDAADAGKLIVLAARPGVGKTLVAMNMASHIAQAGRKVGVWSLEMGSEQVAQRVLCSLALQKSGWQPGQPFNSGDHLSYNMLRTRSFKGLNPGVEEKFRALSNSDEFQQVKENLHVFSKFGAPTPETVVSQMTMFAQTHKDCGLLILDHFHLLAVDGNNQAIALGEASRMLKDMARRLSIDVLLLCQLNRGLEQRQDKRPELSDLRGSGRIEEDADVVIGLSRTREDEPESMMLTINKNRQGSMGEFTAVAKLSCCAVFEDSLI